MAVSRLGPTGRTTRQSCTVDASQGRGFEAANRTTGNRRRYLGLVAGSMLGGVAGCAGNEASAPVAGTPSSIEGLSTGEPVVVATASGKTLVAYDRRVSSRARSFAAAGEAFLRAGGSRWRRTTGVAVDGPREGTRLARATPCRRCSGSGGRIQPRDDGLRRRDGVKRDTRERRLTRRQSEILFSPIGFVRGAPP